MKFAASARSAITGVNVVTLSTAVVLVGVLAVPTRLSSCDLSYYIRGEVVRKVAVTKPADLARLLPETRADYAAHLLLLSRLVATDQSNDETVGELLSQMPSSKIEFDLLFAITTVDEWRLADVRAAFNGFFDLVGALGSKRLDFAEAALKLSYFADGEAKDYTDDIAERICKEAPHLFAKALKTLPPDERVYVPPCDNASN
jgi:hypothetical protein